MNMEDNRLVLVKESVLGDWLLAKCKKLNE